MTTDSSKRTLFSVVPKELIRKFLWFQVFLAIIPVVTFILLMLNLVHLPGRFPGDAIINVEWLERASLGLGKILIIASLFSFSSLFCCIGLFVSHAGREEYKNLVEDQNRIREGATHGFSLIVSINFLGVVFGILAVFIFMGGFISGSIFPTFGNSEDNGLSLLSTIETLTSFGIWAKLAIWSFLFGFSERLLPNLLNNFSRQLDSKLEEETNRTEEDEAEKPDVPGEEEGDKPKGDPPAGGEDQNS